MSDRGNDIGARIEGWTRLFLSPAGRIGRLPFLWGALAAFVLIGIAGAVLHGTVTWLLLNERNVYAITLTTLTLMLNFGYSWVCFSLISKRLHDIGVPGWLAVFVFFGATFALINTSLGGLGFQRIPFSISQKVQSVYLIIFCLAHLVLVLWPGTKGPNRHGLPSGQKAAAPVAVFD
ncbi:MAG: DUF805 domain-containing protein [Asticcacaulis sp.]